MFIQNKIELFNKQIFILILLILLALYFAIFIHSGKIEGFFLILGVITVYIIMKKPFIGIVLLVAGGPILNPLVRSGTGILGISWSKVVLLSLLLALLAQAVVLKIKLPSFDIVLKLLIFYAFIVLISTTKSLIDVSTSYINVCLAPILIYYTSTYLITEKTSVYKLIGAMAFVGLFVSIIIYLEFLTGYNIYATFETAPRVPFQFSGPFFNPNWTGAFLVVISPYIWYRFFKEKRKYYLFVSIAIVGGIVLTISRKSFLAFLVVMIFYFLRGSDKKSIVPILLILSLMGASYFSIQHFRDIEGYRTSRLENISSEARGRMALIKGGFEVFKGHIIFGGGYGNSSLIHQQYSGKRAESYSVHNNYIAVLADNGVAGFIPFIFSILAPLAVALTSYKKDWAKNNKDFFKAFSSMVIGLLFISWGGSFFQLTVISSFFWAIASVVMRGKEVMADKKKI